MKKGDRLLFCHNIFTQQKSSLSPFFLTDDIPDLY